jgi:hypothetical protein
MPRLTREWDKWFASAEDLRDEVYFAKLSSNLSIAHPLPGDVSKQIIYKKPRGVNQKITLAEANTKLWFSGFDPRDIDSLACGGVVSRYARLFCSKIPDT